MKVSQVNVGIVVHRMSALAWPRKGRGTPACGMFAMGSQRCAHAQAPSRPPPGLGTLLASGAGGTANWGTEMHPMSAAPRHTETFRAFRKWPVRPCRNHRERSCFGHGPSPGREAA